MANTVENPFDSQPEAPKPGIIGGVINSVPNTSAAASTAAPYNPTANLQPQTFTAQTREVDAPTETTQGQLASILSTDSPLMQRARTLATQQMAQRGLVNSSMNGEAGVAAMIDRATPIAGADAAVYDARARTNMDATNTTGMFNVGQNNQLVGQGLSIAAQMAGQKDQQAFVAGESAADRAQQAAMLDKQQAFSGSQADIDRNLQVTQLQAQQTFASAQAELDRALQVAQTDKSIAAQQSLQLAQQKFSEAQAELDRTQQSTMQKTQQEFSAVQAQLDREQQVALTELQAKFSESAASRDFAATTASGTLASINTILGDPNLKPEAKRAAINNIIAAANSTMQWAGTFYQTELPPVKAPG